MRDKDPHRCKKVFQFYSRLFSFALFCFSFDFLVTRKEIAAWHDDLMRAAGFEIYCTLKFWKYKNEIYLVRNLLDMGQNDMEITITSGWYSYLSH